MPNMYDDAPLTDFAFQIPARPSYDVGIEADGVIRVTADRDDQSSVWFYADDAERIANAIIDAVKRIRR